LLVPEAVLDLVVGADPPDDVGLCADRLRGHCRHDQLPVSIAEASAPSPTRAREMRPGSPASRLLRATFVAAMRPFAPWRGSNSTLAPANSVCAPSRDGSTKRSGPPASGATNACPLLAFTQVIVPVAIKQYLLDR